MKVALIGNGTQSKRIQKILDKKKIKYEIYTSSDNIIKKNDKKKFKNFSSIFILTPINNHIEYLKFFNNKFIFCEKPPVNDLNSLKLLRKINFKKVYFNFNFRFSKLSQILNNRKKYNLGKILNIKIILSHGLAKKKEYFKNWRSNKKKCPTGVFEIVLIHYIDLINKYFGIKNFKSINLSNSSNCGTGYDTAECDLVLNDGYSKANLFATYNGPLIKKILLLFDNGVIEQNEDKIKINGPAKNFDSKGFFIKPKCIKYYKIGEKKDYEQSLEKSVTFFLESIKKNRTFKKKNFIRILKNSSYLKKL